jgi:hypothetical protein
MRRRISLFIFLLLLIPILSISTSGYSGPELKVGVYGASMLTGLKEVGCFVYNLGEENIYDITFTFTVEGGFDNSINKLLYGHKEILEPNTAYLLPISSINGFGPIILSIEATSSNAGTAEKTIKGFQLGAYSITQPYFLAWL